MNKDEWQHLAINELSVIFAYTHLLRKNAMSNINEDMAIEMRDLTDDIIHKIDMFEKKNVPLKRFIEGCV